MSLPPQIMQQMLMQKLQQNPGSPMAGGGNAGPQMQGQVSPMNAASQLMQKIMLMKALQNAPQTPGGATGGQQRQANNMLPQTNALMARDPQIQALQQGQPLPMQFPQQPPVDPSLQPIAGYS